MNHETLLQQFDQLNVWSRGGERAPHKPLLVLYALGRWSRGETGDIPFADVDRDLTPLLKEFGRSRRSYHPEFPFWYLKNDGVWEVRSSSPLKMRIGSSSPLKSELLANNVQAGFSDDVQQALRADPSLIGKIAGRLLEEHFPESLHPDILAAVGLTLDAGLTTRRKRDPHFRQRVLTAYEYRCAFCGFDVRLGSITVALDAAHIRWVQAAGPDEERNGLALCVLHHKLFDLGAFTLEAGGCLLVSEQAHGSTGFEDSLMRHHGSPVRTPQRPEWYPASEFLKWHGKEVFKGAARHRA
jgi:putative restriction endonuclease